MTINVTKNLVSQAAGGDKTAYARLMRLQYKRVFLLCYGILGNEHDAEDITQEAFLKGFVKLKSLRNPAHFDRWIGKIAKHLAISHLRKRKKHRRLQDGACRSPDPLNQQDRFEGLDDAIRQLPVDLRTPLVMYYFDGRKVPAVARTLGISSSNVYLRLRSALAQLKDSFQQGEQS